IRFNPAQFAGPHQTFLEMVDFERRKYSHYSSGIKKAVARATQAAEILRSLVPFVQVILRNNSGDVICFSAVSVSRATHLPAISGSRETWPAPAPSVHGQSLPNISL